MIIIALKTITTILNVWFILVGMDTAMKQMRDNKDIGFFLVFCILQTINTAFIWV